MICISVNVGGLRPLRRGNKSGQSGIFKQPVAGPVAITAEGLAADAIADKKHHGGPDQAVYIYGAPDYAWWSAELGADLAPGTFGDNLTISGLESARFAIGDYLHIGDEVTLQVTAPRIPCSTLAARMADPTFVRRFRAAERPGLYCRVLRAGDVQAGDAVRVEPYEGDAIPILQSFRDFYEPDLSVATLQRYLAAPIAIRDRAEKEQQLAEARAAAGH
jgi:MOSC domain-containing protein YiiM